MSTIIANEFSFAKDFRSVRWRATLIYNMLRAFGGGIVIGALMLLLPSRTDWTFLAAPILWPIGYVIFFAPIGLASVFLAKLIPIAGLGAFFMSIMSVAIGDWLVCIIKEFFPHAVPVEAPTLFSLNIVIFVLDAPEYAIAGDLR